MEVEEIKEGREMISFHAREEGIHGWKLLAKCCREMQLVRGRNRGEEEDNIKEKLLEATWRVPIWDFFFFFFQIIVKCPSCPSIIGRKSPNCP